MKGACQCRQVGLWHVPGRGRPAWGRVLAFDWASTEPSESRPLARWPNVSAHQLASIQSGQVYSSYSAKMQPEGHGGPDSDSSLNAEPEVATPSLLSLLSVAGCQWPQPRPMKHPAAAVAFGVAPGGPAVAGRRATARS
jgi:hypothetical protein